MSALLNADLVALLAEARLLCDLPGRTDVFNAARESLAKRIDAALAAYAEQEKALTWKHVWRGDGFVQSALCNNAVIQVWPTSTGYAWRVGAIEGEEYVEAEAKEAAIKVAMEAR